MRGIKRNLFTEEFAEKIKNLSNLAAKATGLGTLHLAKNNEQVKTINVGSDSFQKIGMGSIIGRAAKFGKLTSLTK
jgi:hypothetical protein